MAEAKQRLCIVVKDLVGDILRQAQPLDIGEGLLVGFVILQYRVVAAGYQLTAAPCVSTISGRPTSALVAASVASASTGRLALPAISMASTAKAPPSSMTSDEYAWASARRACIASSSARAARALSSARCCAV